MTKGELRNPQGAHLSEFNFRRFESLLQKIIHEHPEPQLFTPAEMAPTTFAARLREAVNALFLHEYHTIIDIPQFRELWKTLTVSIRDKKVLVATREAAHMAQVLIAQEAGAAPARLIIQNPDLDTLLALSTLLLKQVLTDPVRLTGNIPEFTPPVGIVFEPNDDGSYTML